MIAYCLKMGEEEVDVDEGFGREEGEGYIVILIMILDSFDEGR